MSKYQNIKTYGANMSTRILSLFLAMVVLAGVVFVDNDKAFAGEPRLFEKAQHGIIIEAVHASFTQKQNTELSYVSKKGKQKSLRFNSKLIVLGKSRENSKYFYVKKKFDSNWLYGYVDNKYVAIDNSYNYEEKHSEKIKNPYDKKYYVYPYYEYNDMPIYQFYQCRPGSINGLKINCSCGPHSLATILSAVTKQVIQPEEIMYNMSKSSIVPSGKGSYAGKVTESVSDYIAKKYKYRYKYEKISPTKVFDYLSDGYFIILGLENLDNQNLFTQYSHYITLIGYDMTGNIMTVNTNKKTALLESFSKSRLKKLMKNSDFYNQNTVAIKYEDENAYYEYEEPIKTNVRNATKIYENFDWGFFNSVGKNKKITVLGKMDDRFYVEYIKDGKVLYGFIPMEDTCLYVNAALSKDTFYFDSKAHKPKVIVTDNDGNELVKDVDYTLKYSDENSTEIGSYKVKIKYLSGHIGASELRYKIVLKGTTISSLKNSKKKVLVKLNKAQNISGYQIEYAKFSDFSDSLEKEVSKNSSSVYIKTNFKKRKYYFRVRTYKNVNSKKVYSEWSKPKSIYVK